MEDGWKNWRAREYLSHTRCFPSVEFRAIKQAVFKRGYFFFGVPYLEEQQALPASVCSMAAKMVHGDVEDSVADLDGAGEAVGSTNGGTKQDTLPPTVETNNVNVDDGKALKIGIYGMVNAMMAIPILYGYAAIIFRLVGPYFCGIGHCTCPGGSYKISPKTGNVTCSCWCGQQVGLVDFDHVLRTVVNSRRTHTPRA